MGLFLISHDQGYNSRNSDTLIQRGEQTPVGSWGTLMDQLAPKTPYPPFMWHPKKEPRGPMLPREEQPNVPKPGQKEEKTSSNSTPEIPPLHSHCLIPKASKSSRIRDSKPAVLMQSQEFHNAAKPQRPNKNSSSTINHTHPINHTLPINPSPAVRSCEGWRRRRRRRRVAPRMELLGFGRLCS